MSTIENYVDKVHKEFKDQQADDLSFVSQNEHFLDKFIEKVRVRTTEELGSGKPSIFNLS